MSVPCAPPALPARASISGRQRGQRRVLCSAAAHTRLPDPLLLSLGVDDAATGGAQLAQSALADALAAGITSGYLPCDPASLGQGTAAQAASARALLLGAGVLRRGSQRGAEQYFVTTPGLPALAADSLLDRLHLAAARALQRWVDGGGQGAAGITHLVLGSITPPRSAPGTFPLSLLALSHARAGPDVALLARLGLPASCQRVPQHHLGCHGALRALALAAQIARGDPLARVLVVYGDVMSTLGAFMPTPLAAEDLRSVAVFTDGAAAAVVAGCEGEGLGVPLARIIAARSELLSEEGAAGADALRLRARYNDATAGLALQMTLPVDWAQQTGALIGCVVPHTQMAQFCECLRHDAFAAGPLLKHC